MHLGIEDRVNVRLETFLTHALEEEADGRGIGDVRGRCGASTASEEAADAPEAIDDDRTRVTPLREGAGLEVEWEDRPRFGGLVFTAFVVVPRVGVNVVRTADGLAGGPTVLEHQ